jgi:hypothetical protein
LPGKGGEPIPEYIHRRQLPSGPTIGGWSSRSGQTRKAAYGVAVALETQRYGHLSVPAGRSAVRFTTPEPSLFMR